MLQPYKAKYLRTWTLGCIVRGVRLDGVRAGSMIETFDAVISLGGRCQVAHQLRRKYPGMKSKFFDWLITPDKSLIEMLADGMTGFSEETPLVEGLSHRKNFGHVHIVEGSYGTLLSHDFVNDGSEPGTQWKQIKGKYDRTVLRFHETLDSGGRVLFVRMSFGRSGSFGYDVADRANLELGMQISASISKYWPYLEYSLILISHVREDAVVNGNIEIVYMPEQLEWIWDGKDLDWDYLLDSRVKVSVIKNI
jgi:Putative papain-like cysteine peptidase (DUF1796)